jgi:Domain of unknown function (DUF4375)
MLPWADGLKQMPAEPTDSSEDNLLIELSEKIFRQTEQFNEAQKVFARVWLLEAEVNNGGFDQFFFNSSGDEAAETPDALDTIGAHQAAELARRANSVFPDGGPSKDRQARQAQLDSLDSANESLSELDAEFYEYPDNLTSLLTAFVKEHSDQF